MQVIFMHKASLEQMDDDLGEVLGCALKWDGGLTGGKQGMTQRNYVAAVMRKSLALKEVAQKYPWIETLVERTLSGKMSTLKTIETTLERVEEPEARVIGNNLMPCLKNRKTPRAGVDLWAKRNIAVMELFVEFPWMRNVFTSIGERVVKAAPWGLFWRVFLGAAVSLTDIITDIVVAATFLKEKRYSYLILTVSMIAACMLLQGALVVGQNYRRGFKRTVIELIPVLTCFKPCIDAFRVASGSKMQPGNLFDPLTEMTYTKCIEMFAESIPGVLIQLSAIATTDKVSSSTIIWTSLAASALTTGYTAATISYNFDTDPSRREEDANFYGYVPEDIKRSVITFMSMAVFSSCTLMVRSSTLVILGLISYKYAVGFFSLDMLLYLAIKIVRNDFAYWIPGSGISSLVMSLTMRVVIKSIVDFTQITHFRHPYELGGVYWCVGVLLSLTAFPISLTLYTSVKGHDRVSSLSENAIYVLLPSTVIR